MERVYNPRFARSATDGAAREIAVRREQLGLSQRQLALRSGVSPQTLWRIEKGLQRPLPDTVRALAVALRCKVDDLVPGWERDCEEADAQPMSIGHGLRIVRKERRVTLAAAAAALEANPATLSRFERGLHRSRALLEGNAVIASEPLADLLGFDDANALKAACAALCAPAPALPDDDPPRDGFSLLDCA